MSIDKSLPDVIDGERAECDDPNCNNLHFIQTCSDGTKHVLTFTPETALSFAEMLAEFAAGACQKDDETCH